MGHYSKGFSVKSVSPDKRPGYSQHGAYKPCGMSNDQRPQVLPQSSIATQSNRLIYRQIGLYMSTSHGQNPQNKSISFDITPLVPPSVNHLVTLLEPADPRHLAARCGSIHVDDQIIFSHEHLQTADDVAAWEEKQCMTETTGVGGIKTCKNGTYTVPTDGL